MSPGEHLGKAARALASARLLLADGDTDGACNRAYYAMFDAARAALLAVSPDIDQAIFKTHRGLIANFGLKLVKPGRLPADLGRGLNQVEHIRLLADYTGEAIEPGQARWAIEQAETFLNTIQQNHLQAWQPPIEGGDN